MRTRLPRPIWLALGGTLLIACGLGPAAASAGAAALYGQARPGVQIELQTDDGRILRLFVKAPVTCQREGGAERVRSYYLVDTAGQNFNGGLYQPIRLNPATGSFRFEERVSYRSYSQLTVAKGTVRRGRVRLSYRYHALTRADPESGTEAEECWSGESRAGEFVPLSAPRKRGGRFYSQFEPGLRISMWIQGGKIERLRLFTRGTCDQHGPPASSEGRSRGWVSFTPTDPVPIDERGRFHLREGFDFYYGATADHLSGVVRRDRVIGTFSHTSNSLYPNTDENGSSTSVICWTGRSNRSPGVDFNAKRG